jgi:diaminohydroxyphosphoribosylaminopyrimidine deaminase / 5-amino-6-(5-phosphoribosylamino)uracil reductase
VQDEHYMRVELQLAELGRYQTMPNPMVGAVIVHQNEIVGQGAHLKAGEPHAEVHALRMAGEKARGATLYVTLEPCSHHGRTPPCADAVISAGITRVVIATEDQNPIVQGNGIRRLRDAGLEVVTGVFAEEAYRLNEMFFTSVLHGRPFVVWKCASTLDGYIATHGGDSKYVTSALSRQSVQQLRRELPSIAVGIGTVLADNPRLTVRDEVAMQPLRVVFDSRLRFPTTAKMLEEPGNTLIYTLCSATEIHQSVLHQSRPNLRL